MSVQIKSQVIDGKAVDFIEVNGKEVAQILDGVNYKDFEDVINEAAECDCSEGYSDSDMEESCRSGKSELADEVSKFIESNKVFSKRGIDKVTKFLAGKV